MIARNPLGQSEATCRVVLGDIPDSPDSPSVEAMTDTDILLSWKTPARLNHAPIVCYKVQMGYIGKTDTITKVTSRNLAWVPFNVSAKSWSEV